ncbi:MAG TPA: DNA repair exonuclease, partial [Spirochaetes bacterium]|nr:DNA repair exonuclease [Spirochaetota bacterium]
MFRFIHTADIHLDSPLTGLELYEGAPVEEIRQATRRAFENLVQFAMDEKIDFILIAGDLYDGNWRDFNTGLFFVTQMVKLKEAHIPVYIVSGNHDAASRITQKIPLPANVTIFSTKKPQTIVIEEFAVAIHGQGFIKPAVYDNLSKEYPDPIQGYFNIGLLHTCAEGAEGHEKYAPCSVEELKNKGYDYWALG